MVWLTFSVSAIGVILIPLLVMIYSLVRKLTMIEVNQANLIDDVKQLVADKDKVHAEMLSAMREDRQATDRRLSFLERHLWRVLRDNGGPDK